MGCGAGRRALALLLQALGDQESELQGLIRIEARIASVW